MSVLLTIRINTLSNDTFARHTGSLVDAGLYNFMRHDVT